MSVCTLVRDRNEMLSRLIQGLARSAVTPLELVIIRAGGEDPREVVPRHPTFRIEVLDAPGDADIPYSRARNMAAGRARGEFVCFLDADAIPAAGMVGAFVRALAEVDALCIGEIRYLPRGAVDADWSERGLRRAGRRHPARPPAPRAGFTLSEAHELVWGTCFALRRRRFLALGGFDESFRGYAGEDTDLALRARRMGVPVAVVRAADVFHQYHPVWSPPLHQFRATLANADVFRHRHGRWPMEGWLAEYERLGLISRDGGRIEVLRDPTRAELECAREAGDLRLVRPTTVAVR